ncbi:proline-rich extensin-like protein EPR1 isoform X1 [Puntigrus tetrazona]|uniref:proline-rich extensin-like protein EPR1 isoform X1 n=1 Tax=Puntigrus tetrazona TaxID=1606681 RepID=UPI001C897A0B|nr:proline-rich extensin-like protein EPR1 isoform X1 [Puntigrus tetrazona]
MCGQWKRLIDGTRSRDLEHRSGAFSSGKTELQNHMVVVSVCLRGSVLSVNPMRSHSSQMIQRDTFVLPLRLWGLPVKMSCSSLTSAKREPTVSCYTNGMIVRLYGGVSEKLKIKVINEWQPLLKVSAKCGYSLVSHPEGVVIHAPYMPCTEPKDGMFTLSMLVESEFNLSCPALSLSFPLDTPNLSRESEPVSIPLTSSTLPPTTITTTTKTTQPRETPRSSTTSTSSVKKLPTPPFPYYIPGQPDFKPPPSYPFLPFPPNNAPAILPQGPKIVVPPFDFTQRPQPPIYLKRPQTWYPWYPRPSLGLQVGPLYPRKPLLRPTEAPTAPIAPLLKPTSSPQDKLTSTVPVVPPEPWAPMFPPSNMVYPLYPGKPEFAAPSSAGFPPVPYWPYRPQTQQRPSEPHAPPKPEPEPPKPTPTTKTGPWSLPHPWYIPLPPHGSEMPPIPKNDTAFNSEDVASQSTTHSEKSEHDKKTPTSEDLPSKLEFDFTPDTEPTPSLPKCPEVVHTTAPTEPAPKEPSPPPICLSHAHCFHCPTLCPGPPSVFYHHHNHHHFGPPLQMSNFDISSMTKITGQMLSSPVIPPDSNLFALIKGMGYNYGPLYSKTLLPPASDRTEMQYLVENPPIKKTEVTGTSRPTVCPYIFSKLESTAATTQPTVKPANVAPDIRHLEPSQNGPVVEPSAYSNNSPNPVVNQAEMQYGDAVVSPMGRETESVLVAPNNVPSSMEPTNGKKTFMNYWHQAGNLNVKPPRSNSLTNDYFPQMSLPQTRSNYNPFYQSAGSIQPEEPPDENPSPQLTFHPSMQIHNSAPVMNPQLYVPPNVESVDPVFRGPNLFNTHWVPAAQPNMDALLSSSQTDGYMGHPSAVD